MNNLFLHILKPHFLKSTDKCQRYTHFIACRPSFKNDTYGTANTLCVFTTTKFISAVGRVTAIALNLYSIISCRNQSHYQDPDLNLAVMKNLHPVLVAAVGVNHVHRLPFLKLDPQAFKWCKSCQ